MPHSQDDQDTWESLGLSAALANSYAQDARGFLPLLAGFLQAALPDATTMERKGGLFQKQKPIHKITVTLGENIYTLEDTGRGVPVTQRTKIVRGIRLKTETMPMEEWLAALSEEIGRHAQRNEAAFFALKELLPMKCFFPNHRPDERQARSQEQMARGGLPVNAEERLREMHGRADFFTSDLSVNEFVLAADDGIRPLGQVMGSTIYHVGWQYTPMYISGELTTLTQAQTQARKLALSRLQQEAKLLGAHGVIGVRLERKDAGVGREPAGMDGARHGRCHGQGRRARPALRLRPERAGVLDPAARRLRPRRLRLRNVRPVPRRHRDVPEHHAAAGVLREHRVQGLRTGHRLRPPQGHEPPASRGPQVAAEGVVGVTVETDIRTPEADSGSGKHKDLIVHFTALGTAVVPRRDRWPIIDYALPLSHL